MRTKTISKSEMNNLFGGTSSPDGEPWGGLPGGQFVHDWVLCDPTEDGWGFAADVVLTATGFKVVKWGGKGLWRLGKAIF